MLESTRLEAVRDAAGRETQGAVGDWSRKLAETQSKTPAITLHSSVSLDIRRHEAQGLPPRVSKLRFPLENGSFPAMNQSFETPQVGTSRPVDLLDRGDRATRSPQERA